MIIRLVETRDYFDNEVANVTVDPNNPNILKTEHLTIQKIDRYSKTSNAYRYLITTDSNKKCQILADLENQLVCNYGTYLDRISYEYLWSYYYLELEACNFPPPFKEKVMYDWKNDLIVPDSVDTVFVSPTVRSIQSKFPYRSALGSPHIKNIILPSSVKKLGRNVFSNSGISTIDLPDKISELPVGCFSSCTELEKVGLPLYLNRIGSSCFNYCVKLKSITLYEMVEQIDCFAFSGCPLTDITYEGTVSGWKKIIIGAGWSTGGTVFSSNPVVHCHDGDIQL